MNTYIGMNDIATVYCLASPFYSRNITRIAYSDIHKFHKVELHEVEITKYTRQISRFLNTFIIPAVSLSRIK